MKFLVQLLVFISLLFPITSHAQASIGQTENEIRSEYGSKPDIDINVTYIHGEKTLIVVDKDATASFTLNKFSSLCYKSVFQFRNKEILKNLIIKFDRDYQVVKKGSSWITSLKGHEIRIELRYSEKLQSDMLFAIQTN